ncbi:MAG: hypothetical protein DDG59_11345 [Anaerolineae bacterium]|nr:MAG: hypothetical protein DDG59_11345 [Anaerolineae bacterium]
MALELIRDGEIPLWNPYSGMGAPLLANYQSALLYPPTWILMALEALGGLEWSAIGQGIFIALHLGFCAVGTKRFLQDWGIKDLGQMVGGIAFGLSGYLVSRASFQSIVFSVSWMPWILLFAQRLAFSNNRYQKRRNVSRLVVSLAMNFLAGHAQSSWYILWTGTLWMIWQSLLVNPFGWRAIGQRLGKNLFWWGLSVCWAAFIAAAQLIPTGEYLLNSQRSTGIDREVGLTYSYWPWRFLTLLMPDFFGNPARDTYWGYANYWEDAVYSGSMAVLLGIFAIGKLWFKRTTQSTGIVAHHHLKPIVLFWGGISIVAMVLALGKNLPFYAWLLDTVPGFDLFQAPTRISLIAQFGLAVLAAVGMDQWEAPHGKILYWTRLATAGFFSMFLVSSLVSFQFRDFYPTILKSFQLFGLMGLVFGLLLLLKPQDKESEDHPQRMIPRFSRIWTISIFMFFLVDLFRMGWGLNPVISIELYHQSSKDRDERKFALSQRFFLHPDDEYVIKFERFFRFDTFRNLKDWRALRQSWLPNINLLDETAMVNNFDPFVPARYARWLETVADLRRKGDNLTYLWLLRMSGVDSLIEIEGLEAWKIIPLEGSERWQFFPCAEVVKTSDEALTKVLSDPEFGLSKLVLESEKENLDAACRTQADSAATIDVFTESANRIQVKVDTSQGGWLMLKDAFYPGWIGRVNGVKKPIFAANGVFRAIQVHPGTNLVEFHYRPISFELGSILSVLSLMTLVFYRGMRKDD